MRTQVLLLVILVLCTLTVEINAGKKGKKTKLTSNGKIKGSSHSTKLRGTKVHSPKAIGSPMKYLHVLSTKLKNIVSPKSLGDAGQNINKPKKSKHQSKSVFKSKSRHKSVGMRKSKKSKSKSVSKSKGKSKKRKSWSISRSKSISKSRKRKSKSKSVSKSKGKSKGRKDWAKSGSKSISKSKKRKSNSKSVSKSKSKSKKRNDWSKSRSKSISKSKKRERKSKSVSKSKSKSKKRKDWSKSRSKSISKSKKRKSNSKSVSKSKSKSKKRNDWSKSRSKSISKSKKRERKSKSVSKSKSKSKKRNDWSKSRSKSISKSKKRKSSSKSVSVSKSQSQSRPKSKSKSNSNSRSKTRSTRGSKSHSKSGSSSEEQPDEPGIGIVAGDPFYRTFDGARLEFQGRCHYRLTGTCEGCNLPALTPPFSIDVANAKSPHDVDRSYTRLVHLDMAYHRLKLSDMGLVELDDVWMAPSDIESENGYSTYFGKFKVNIKKHKFNVIVNIDDLFKIEFDGRGETGRHVVKVTIISQSYRGHMCGILGNWDNDASNDRFPKGTSQMGTDTEVGNSWIIDGTECM